MSENQNKTLDHEYDGIKECDNQLPRWWLWIFYVTVIHSFGYMVYYHMGGGISQVERFERELKAERAVKVAEMADKPIQTADVEAATKDSKSMISAKGLFAEKCSSCHAADGGGGIGPNLTDAYWIHGSRPEQVAKVISDGVVEKGMISWKTLLNRDQIISLAAYVGSIRNSTPANPKAPQGEKVGD